MGSYHRRVGTSFHRKSTLLSLCATAAAALTLLAPGATQGDTLSPLYSSTPLTMSGNLAGLANVSIPSGADLLVEGMTDNGLITFSAAPVHSLLPAMLLQWSDGVITPIVVPGGSRSPHWPLDVYWPRNVGVDRPISVNGNGDVVFSVDNPYGTAPWATYLWAASNQTGIPVRLQGEPATGSLMFTKPGGFAPAINNHDEIALIGQVHNPSGPGGYGLFFLGQFPGENQVLRPVLLPGDILPVDASGEIKAVTEEYFKPSIDDNGRIAFLSQLHGSSWYSAYVWEYGGNDQVMISGTYLHSGARIAGVSSVSLNNRDRSVLVTAHTNRMKSNQYGLYRVLNGAITPIVEPGAVMPGGGTVQTVQYTEPQEDSPPLMGVSEANAAGQYVFLATLTDGSTGAYRLDPNDSLTPIFQTNPASGSAHVADVIPGVTFVPGSRPCINSRGQIALSVRPDKSHSMIMLLTPNP